MSEVKIRRIPTIPNPDRQPKIFKYDLTISECKLAIIGIGSATIDWGDGTSETITFETEGACHVYEEFSLVPAIYNTHEKILELKKKHPEAKISDIRKAPEYCHEYKDKKTWVTVIVNGDIIKMSCISKHCISKHGTDLDASITFRIKATLIESSKGEIVIRISDMADLMQQSRSPRAFNQYFVHHCLDDLSALPWTFGGGWEADTRGEND